jgi:hypothetical protein
MTDRTNSTRLAAANATAHKRFNAGRRRFIMAAGAAVIGSTVAGCATPVARSGRSISPGQRVDLLYLADTLESLQPTRVAAPATYLGPADLLGEAPWATANGVATLARSPMPGWQTRCVPSQAARRYTAGLGPLAARLERLRATLGSDRTLTLENGQCWSGSGLGHLANGRTGVASSHLLASDARVSSDERVLWPGQVAGLYRQYDRPVLGSLEPSVAGVVPATHFERGGARIAVIGATDPHAFDESRNLDSWYQALATSAAQAAERADLVILLADTGSGPARWLAERLPDIDLVLAARSLDFWPELIEVSHQAGHRVPLCLPGSQGLGCYQLSCISDREGWRIESRFHSMDGEGADPAERERGQQLQARFDALRAPYAAWLDLPLATAPGWLWRRDSVGGSWDGLIAAALADGSAPAGETPHSLLPGLRYDALVAPGEAITRDHLLRLTGGYAARVANLELDSSDLQRLVEQGVDNSLGAPLIINTSHDLPRLLGSDWQLRYGAGLGERVRIDGAPGTHTWQTFSVNPRIAAGEPLWQRMERYLVAHATALPLPERPNLEARYLDGHPGWHPEARLT